MLEVQNDPDRVTQPLRRRPDGEFEAATWDEALDDIAARVARVRTRHGGGSVGWYMGNPGAFSFSHTLWAKGFLDALGSQHYYTASSQDISNRFAASALLYGSPLVVPIPDVPRTDLLVLVGANPLVSHGSALTAPRIREELHGVVDRGGRVVVIDPRRSETARAFEHVAIRPDSDALLLLSVLHVLFAEGLVDDAALAAQATGRGALERWVAGHPPEATADGDRRRARDGPRAGPRPRRRAVGRGLRAHRLVPGALRHARLLPARRGQRRDRQPRPPGRLGDGDAGDRARRGRRAARPRHLRRHALAGRRLPRRDRRHARLADGRGDRHARPRAAARPVRLGRQPRALGPRRRRAGRRLRRPRPARLARPLRQRDQPPRRLGAAGHDVPRARGPARRLLRLPRHALRPVDRAGRRAAGRGAPGVGGHRRALRAAGPRAQPERHPAPPRPPRDELADPAPPRRPAAAHRAGGRPLRAAPGRALPVAPAQAPAR